MKQYITVEQLKELSEEAKLRLQLVLPEEGPTLPEKLPFRVVWTTAKYPSEESYYLPLLSIGQMMEFLVDHKDYLFLSDLQRNTPDTWCDCLWEAVKEVLEPTTQEGERC